MMVGWGVWCVTVDVMYEVLHSVHTCVSLCYSRDTCWPSPIRIVLTTDMLSVVCQCGYDEEMVRWCAYVRWVVWWWRKEGLGCGVLVIHVISYQLYTYNNISIHPVHRKMFTHTYTLCFPLRLTVSSPYVCIPYIHVYLCFVVHPICWKTLLFICNMFVLSTSNILFPPYVIWRIIVMYTYNDCICMLITRFRYIIRRLSYIHTVLFSYIRCVLFSYQCIMFQIHDELYFLLHTSCFFFSYVWLISSSSILYYYVTQCISIIRY